MARYMEQESKLAGGGGYPVKVLVKRGDFAYVLFFSSLLPKGTCHIQRVIWYTTYATAASPAGRIFKTFTPSGSSSRVISSRALLNCRQSDWSGISFPSTEHLMILYLALSPAT
ncbi:hypothetical protein DTO027B5_7039 [Paecilomyces variotii]|nr:hypothetical protein DTO169C6_9186 [Paecilomyces variotii]KAJ9331210.1 hypothetical protein DTO027B5_7039 [Paecilomyces variotii]